MRTKFFTGKGDKGKSTIGKTKISKSAPLFDALGYLDELNSWVGFAKVEAEKVFSRKKSSIPILKILRAIQELLFIAQAEIASIGFGYPLEQKILAKYTKFLEDHIKKIDKHLPKIKSFIVPGGSELAARLDISRAMSRNFERILVKLKSKKFSPELLSFFNRLSSLLFALARYVNHELRIKEEHPKYKI